MTFQPVQRSKKSTKQPWTPGLVCNDQGCYYKADSDTLAWLKELFDGFDTDKYDCCWPFICILLLAAISHAFQHLMQHCVTDSMFCNFSGNRDGAITKDDLKGLLRQTNSFLEPAALVSSTPWLAEVFGLLTLDQPLVKQYLNHLLLGTLREAAQCSSAKLRCGCVCRNGCQKLS